MVDYTGVEPAIPTFPRLGCCPGWVYIAQILESQSPEKVAYGWHPRQYAIVDARLAGLLPYSPHYLALSRRVAFFQR